MLCNAPDVSERDLQALLKGKEYMSRVLLHVKYGMTELYSIRSVLERRIDEQSANEVQYAKAQLVQVQEGQKKLLELYLSNLFTKEQLDEQAQALNDGGSDIKAKIFELSKFSDDILADIAEVDETLAFLHEAAQSCHNRIDNNAIYELTDKEDIVAGIEKMIVKPPITLALVVT